MLEFIDSRDIVMIYNNCLSCVVYREGISKSVSSIKERQQQTPATPVKNEVNHVALHMI